MVEMATIQPRTMTAKLEGENFVVRLKIFNPGQRTMYVYGDRRRTLYDNNTGELTLQLHDQYVEEDSVISRHLIQPNFVSLEGNTETEVEIVLPKVMKRIRTAAERGGSGPITEDLRVSEAKKIDVEIAFGDTPFYYNPREDNAKQLKAWGQGVAKVNLNLDPYQPKKKKRRAH